MDVLTEARRVTRRFGPFTAVSGVDLAVRRGEVVGLLGANGAGKTTLIRLLLGLLRPSDGVIRLFGAAPSIATRRRVGYVPQTLGLYSGLTVAENWSFTAAAFHEKGAPLPGAISAWRKELVGNLPLGAQRQVAFAVALSHRPELLVLDEPTSGVGPLNSARLWEGIRHAAGEAAGALVTTHNMEEAEQCDRLDHNGGRESSRQRHGGRCRRRPEGFRGAVRRLEPRIRPARRARVSRAGTRDGPARRQAASGRRRAAFPRGHRCGRRSRSRES